MRRSLAPSTAPESLVHTRSLANFITATSGFRFSVHTAAAVGASNLRRETPVLLRREDGTLLEGVVDLAFREGEGMSAGWTVVDFKTDREFEPCRAAYTAQVAMYAEAIGQATDSSAAGTLLVI